MCRDGANLLERKHCLVEVLLLRRQESGMYLEQDDARVNSLPAIVRDALVLNDPFCEVNRDSLARDRTRPVNVQPSHRRVLWRHRLLKPRAVQAPVSLTK